MARKAPKPRWAQFAEHAAWGDISRKVKDGEALTSIAKWMHDHGLWLNIKQNSIVRYLADYRDSIPPLELLGGGQMPQSVKNKLAELRQGLNELDELRWAAENMKMRLEKRFRFEKKQPAEVPIFSKDTATDVDIFRRLMETSSQIKFRMGVYKEVQPEHGQLTVSPGQRAIQVDEQRQRQLLDATSVVLGLLTGGATKGNGSHGPSASFEQEPTALPV